MNTFGILRVLIPNKAPKVGFDLYAVKLSVEMACLDALRMDGEAVEGAYLMLIHEAPEVPGVLSSCFWNDLSNSSFASSCIFEWTVDVNVQILDVDELVFGFQPFCPCEPPRIQNNNSKTGRRYRTKAARQTQITNTADKTKQKVH